MVWTRRQMLSATGAAWLGAGVAGRAWAAPKKSPKVLFFTKSAGFQHSVIARKDDKLGHAERILTDLGKEHGFEVVASKDGRLFEPDKIGEWDAFVFVTTGDLTQAGTDKSPPMSKDGKKALLDAIQNGKGFIGSHCATDTFHSQGNTVDPYIQMIGGEFITHGAQHVAKLDVFDPDFPGAKAFGSSFEINDEWYALKNLADDLHVIIGYDTKSMKGKMYERPNFPETWARLHGKGRVFYTSMGHREDVWENRLFQGLMLGALGWTTGQVDANVEPNVTKVTPGYLTLGS
ncbi:MAG: ThuA domain-containing protein [Isosphaeraceae bacterium]|nr:ThuA domain-containing protein [Isosphaeraceae bacterium]